MFQTSTRTLFQILLLVSSIAGGPFSAGATEPEPVQSPTGFIEPAIRIAVGANDGSAEVNFRSARMQASAPHVEDSPLPIPLATVKFFPVEGSGNTSSNTWRYRAEVAGLGPGGVTQQRYAKVTYADQTNETFSYTVSNQGTSTFSWTISKPPDPWASSRLLWGPACTSFSVTPKDSVATDVRVAAALVEQTTREAITSDKLRLCKGRDECKGDEKIELPANVPSQLMLCTTKTFRGNFTGSVNLIAREKPDGEAILQKGQFSSFAAKFIGFLVILVGVFFAWLAKVYARARLERDQALLPAIEMRAQIESVRSKLESIDQEYAVLCIKIREQIASLLEELSTDELDKKRLIPRKLPNPFAATGDNAAYKQFLENLNPTIQLLSTLIKNGIVPAVAKDTGTLSPEKQQHVKNAVRNIDAIANTSPPPTTSAALVQLRTILLTLESQLSDAGPAQPESPMTAAQELKVVNLEIESISKGIWMLYSLLTALVGLAALILTNPGFGTPLDFVFAFFWGFALPTTVQSLAPGSVATALNISIAKA